ncbi:MAG: hypothetical protein M0036_15475, partial [Desulfobacteraceae bacterium]|nr:hypothetical protein [Desulfobacteraceae bacterium]
FIFALISNKISWFGQFFCSKHDGCQIWNRKINFCLKYILYQMVIQYKEKLTGQQCICIYQVIAYYSRSAINIDSIAGIRLNYILRDYRAGGT